MRPIAIIALVVGVALVAWWRHEEPTAPVPAHAHGVTVQTMPQPTPPPHRHRQATSHAVTGTGHAASVVTPWPEARHGAAQRTVIAAPTVDLTQWNARQAEIIAHAENTDWLDDWYTPSGEEPNR